MRRRLRARRRTSPSSGGSSWTDGMKSSADYSTMLQKVAETRQLRLLSRSPVGVVYLTAADAVRPGRSLLTSE